MKNGSDLFAYCRLILEMNRSALFSSDCSKLTNNQYIVVDVERGQKIRHNRGSGTCRSSHCTQARPGRNRHARTRKKRGTCPGPESSGVSSDSARSARNPWRSSKILSEGYLNTQGITWRRLNGDEFAHMDVEGEEAEKFGGVLMIGQSRMNEIYLEELKKYPSVDVLFGASCTGVEETPSAVKVMTWQRSSGEQDITYEADYVLASD